MRNWINILFKNDAIFNKLKAPFLILILVFFVNVMLVSAPMFNARVTVQVDELIERFPGLVDAFDELYALNLPCEFEDTIVCSEEIPPTTVGDYELVINGTSEEANYIEFSEEWIRIAHTEDESDQLIITGTYTFLDGLELNNVSESKSYEMTETIVYGIITSGISSDFYLIFAGQFIQNLIYALAIGGMLLASNYRRTEGKIKYSGTLRITVFAMTGPALLTAIIGMFFLPIASVMFMTIYSLRMMFIYFKLMNPNRVNSIDKKAKVIDVVEL